MNEEVEMLIEITSEKMEKSKIHLEKELSKIRAGKADPRMLDGIIVNYYGNNTPVNQVSSINTPDPRTISIQPWEKAMLEIIEKAILAANIGLTPMNNGELIRINVPILTTERRKDLVKQVKNEAENAKIGIRNTRRESNEEIKKLKNDGLSEDIAKDTEDTVQKLTDNYIKKVDEIIEKKEKEILTI
ncbi:MAG: ribosome recycling factor [Bacteroidota bacterium]